MKTEQRKSQGQFRFPPQVKCYLLTQGIVAKCEIWRHSESAFVSLSAGSGQRMTKNSILQHAPQNSLCFKNRASVLVVALWAISLLTVFAVILNAKVKQELAFVSRLETKEKLRFVAESGVKKAIVQIKGADCFNSPSDSLNNAWLNNEALFKERRIGEAIVNVCYESAQGGGAPCLWFGALDEQSKININTADKDVLERLFKLVLGSGEMEAQELAASIVDWRDEDSELSIPLGSAEDEYYSGLRFPYKPKNSAFETLDELLLVKGMTEDRFTKIKNYITIYGNGKVNINTASRFALLSLGLDKDYADNIILFRLGQDGVAGTLDDNVFGEFAEIVPKLSAAFRFSESQGAYLSNMTDRYFTVKSGAFMIRSVAKLVSGKYESCVVCAVNRSGKILYWQEL